MPRLIDADELYSVEKLLDTETIRASKEASWLLDQILFDIKVSPGIDPESLRPHGMWKVTHALIENAVCSNCGAHFQAYYAGYPYCPYCGAKMDGGKTYDAK